VHGIGDVDADELRRKRREYEARQHIQRCGVDGCEYQTKHKFNFNVHQARVHGIGDVGARRTKDRERGRKRRRQPEESEDETGSNEEGENHEVTTVTPRSHRSGARRFLRSRPPVNYAALAGSNSDDSDDQDSDDESENEARFFRPRTQTNSKLTEHACRGSGVRRRWV
jgi:hypothetical protein